MQSDAFLRALGELVRDDAREIPPTDEFSFMRAFVTRKTETARAIALPIAGLLVVVEGVKTLTWAGQTFRYGPGEAFALPEGASVDVINTPQRSTGVYRAAFLGFSSAIIEEARRKWSALASGRSLPDPGVPVGPALRAAVLHASTALAAAPPVSPRVVEHRLLELLLILAELGAPPLRADIRHRSTTEAVRMLLHAAPARPWSAATIARQLCISEPTLRRNLRQEGTGFRQVLAEERMLLARRLLTESGCSVTEAALAGGYSSLSHFSKRFFMLYGQLPSALRAPAFDGRIS